MISFPAWKVAGKLKFEAIVCVWMAMCVVAYVVASCSWPMVGDVSYMHYVVFLMHHGMAPYRDIVEMNLPATYMLEEAVMAVFGPDATGWRIYDLLLLACAIFAMLRLLRPWGRYVGIFAASLFALVHAQDGVIMSGERDFAVAAFLLCGVELLYDAPCAGVWAYPLKGASGVLFGMASMVKPTILPLCAGLLLWQAGRANRRSRRVLPALAAAVAGALLPVLACVVFLVRHHALPAFADAVGGIIRYHASLGHRSLGFLAGHSISPLLPLLIAWIIAVGISFIRSEAASNPELEVRYQALLLCAAGGMLSYLLQQKGFAYQRYPLLAFLLPVISIDLLRVASAKSAARFGGLAGMIVGAILATIFVVRTARFDRRSPERPLLSDLIALGAQQDSVQCMDTAGSCIADLHAGRLAESTGFIYDCYLLDGRDATALDLRHRFWQQMAAKPPRLIVVTDSKCFDPAPSFDKYGGWPEFQSYLKDGYILVRESGPQMPVRYWSRPVAPFAYRIYRRR